MQPNSQLNFSCARTQVSCPPLDGREETVMGTFTTKRCACVVALATCLRCRLEPRTYLVLGGLRRSTIWRCVVAGLNEHRTNRRNAFLRAQRVLVKLVISSSLKTLNDKLIATSLPTYTRRHNDPSKN